MTKQKIDTLYHIIRDEETRYNEVKKNRKERRGKDEKRRDLKKKREERRGKEKREKR